MMTGTGERPGRGPWGWLLPGLLLLGAMTVWGLLRYPELPDRIPQHIGPGGVDAWTDKGVGMAFLPVFLYAGTTALTAGCAFTLTRATPLDAMPASADRWARAAATMNGRPATAASARRMAAALLMTNLLLGVALLPLCWLQWRAEQSAAVPSWVWVATVAAFLASLVPTVRAWWADARERAARQGVTTEDGAGTTSGRPG
ncbi:DUF1648 domain-containing protein [Streptomyces sp. NPDC059853]|uniref:DUF1648 domain-containing protein n=1 Tax=Streptomyces sp. NPDC059853 TaxID=3346973 RepID=UPI0036564CD5